MSKYFRRISLPFLTLALVPALLPAAGPHKVKIETSVHVMMRDGVELVADVYRPDAAGEFPVLLQRTPYNRRGGAGSGRELASHGYIVVIQDTRGRYESEGVFYPFRHETDDGYDTIEWAAQQPWSNGRIGTIGLSYPGAAQWMAAIQSPPHLLAMVPAMTFSRPTNFWYNGGLTDLSWPPWIWINIAPDARARRGLDGPRTVAEGRATWPGFWQTIEHRLPLTDLPELREVAPWYFEWLSHPADDPWWAWADLTTKYDRVRAAVLNISGWHDDPYGPEGALTNHLGLMAARRSEADPRTELILGPWVHGTTGMNDRSSQAASGERVFGSSAGIDYDGEILGFMDRHLGDGRSGVGSVARPRIRVFVMGENAWRSSQRWPLPGTSEVSWYLSAGGSTRHGLVSTRPASAAALTLVSDPEQPVVDPYAGHSGAHDYRALADRPDVLVFESEPLAEPLRVVGRIRAEIYLSVDAPDTDLFVKLFDVAPDGTAWNLMSPGLDGIRASYRDGEPRSLLEKDRVYLLTLPDLMTGNRFDRGHRIRIVLAPSFMPHYGRNLHTGALETESATWRTARLSIRTGGAYPSRIVLPVVP